MANAVCPSDYAVVKIDHFFVTTWKIVCRETNVGIVRAVVLISERCFNEFNLEGAEIWPKTIRWCRNSHRQEVTNFHVIFLSCVYLQLRSLI